MRATWLLPISALLLFDCTTIKLARLDKCTYRTTTRFLGGQTQEVLFCDDDPPEWSNDRAIRLAQECLRHEYTTRRDRLILAQLSGKEPPAPTNDDTFSQCIPESLRVMSSENEALQDRVAKLDETRAKLEKELADTQNDLTKKLADTQAKLGDTQTQMQQQLADSQVKFQQQMSDAQSKFEEKMDATQTAYQKRLDDAQAAYEHKLAEAEDRDDKRLSETQSHYEHRLDDAEARYDKHLTNNEELFAQQHERLENGLTSELTGLSGGLTNGFSGLTNGFSKGLLGLANGFTTGFAGLTNGFSGITSGFATQLGKALERPVNAYAEAKSTSDSGSNVKHTSDSQEIHHVDGQPESARYLETRDVRDADTLAGRPSNGHGADARSGDGHGGDSKDGDSRSDASQRAESRTSDARGNVTRVDVTLTPPAPVTPPATAQTPAAHASHAKPAAKVAIKTTEAKAPICEDSNGCPAATATTDPKPADPTPGSSSGP